MLRAVPILTMLFGGLPFSADPGAEAFASGEDATKRAGVSVRIVRAGKHVSSPELIVKLGEEAQIRQGWKDTELTMSVVLEQNTDGRYEGTFRYEFGDQRRTFSQRLLETEHETIEHTIGDITVHVTVRFGPTASTPKR